MTPEERKEFIEDVAAAIRTRVTDRQLNDDEAQWVRLAIQKEAQSIKLRQAIIEKTLSGLVWVALVAIGLALLEFAKNHLGQR